MLLLLSCNRQEKNNKSSLEQWAKVEDFFKNNQLVLVNFSERYGLFIDKYYHNDSTWDFRFKHPKGGVATVELKYHPEINMITVSGNWYIDVYDEFTRYLKWGDTSIVSNENSLREMLKKYLVEILKWEKSEMTAYRDYENPWKEYSKNEFEAMVNPEIKELKNFEELQ
jgi:hypothetical protein